jgi:putative transcriptional regulator
MLCSNCKAKMREIKTDYRYNESGLDNVILKGITAYECPACKAISPVMKNIKMIHLSIAEAVADKDSLLTGKELAFLRKEMGIKAKGLAQIFGVHKVTLSRWENEKEPVSPPCDRLIRVLYRNKMIEDHCSMLRPEIEKLKLTYPKLENILAASCSLFTQDEMGLKNIKNRRGRPKTISVNAGTISQSRFLPSL